MTKTKQIQNLIERKPNMSVAEIAAKLEVAKGTVYAIRRSLGLAAAQEESEAVSEPRGSAARQVGGDHYTSMAIQPWEVIERNNMGFFEGSALSYIMRFRAKNGVQDLEKARHYLDKLIEMERG